MPKPISSLVVLALAFTSQKCNRPLAGQNRNRGSVVRERVKFQSEYTC